MLPLAKYEVMAFVSQGFSLPGFFLGGGENVELVELFLMQFPPSRFLLFVILSNEPIL